MNQTISMEERNRIENSVKRILPMTWDDKLGFDDIGMKVIGLLNDEVQRVSLMQEEVDRLKAWQDKTNAFVDKLGQENQAQKETIESQAKEISDLKQKIEQMNDSYAHNLAWRENKIDRQQDVNAILMKEATEQEKQISQLKEALKQLRDLGKDPNGMFNLGFFEIIAKALQPSTDKELKPMKEMKTDEPVYFIEHKETHEWWAGQDSFEESFLNPSKPIWTKDPLKAWAFEDDGSARIRAFAYGLDKIITITEHLFV